MKNMLFFKRINHSWNRRVILSNSLTYLAYYWRTGGRKTSTLWEGIDLGGYICFGMSCTNRIRRAPRRYHTIRFSMHAGTHTWGDNNGIDHVAYCRMMAAWSLNGG
jgi:hypothetical protein